MTGLVWGRCIVTGQRLVPELFFLTFLRLGLRGVRNVVEDFEGLVEGLRRAKEQGKIGSYAEGLRLLAKQRGCVLISLVRDFRCCIVDVGRQGVRVLEIIVFCIVALRLRDSPSRTRARSREAVQCCKEK